MKNIWLWNHDATCMFSNQGGRHYWFAENLINQGFETTIFCSNINHFNGSSIKIDGKWSLKIVNHIPFVFIKTAPYQGNGISRIWNWITFYFRLFPVSKEYSKKYGKPDVILASSVHPLTMVAGIQIAKKMGVPCICEVRDLWPEAIFTVNKAKENSVLGRILIYGEHWIYRNANALIFTKEGDIDYLKEHKWLFEQGGDIDIKKCFYINNGVDLNKYKVHISKYQLEDNELNNDKFKVIYTGTIRKVNNLSLVIECAKLLREYSDIQFLIYGDGDYMKDLVALVNIYNLDNIFFKGYVNKKYIPYILSKASINLLNYSQNMYNWSRGNSSNKLFEYMASGKPILSTVKMGYSPLERYHCGISLEDNTPEQMANAILRIKNMSNSERILMGKNAMEGAKDFDFNILTQKLISIINSMTEINKLEER